MSKNEVLISAQLDKSKIRTELKEIQKIIDKHPVSIFSELKTDSLKKQVAAAILEIKKEISKNPISLITQGSGVNGTNPLTSLFADSGTIKSFITLMDGYGKALDSAGIAADSSGTAFQRLEAYSNGVVESLNRVRVSFESLSKTMGSSDFSNTIVGNVSNAMDVLESLANKLEAINVLTDMSGTPEEKGKGKILIKFTMPSFIRLRNNAMQLT